MRTGLVTIRRTQEARPDNAYKDALPMPTWVLALSFWLHMVATVVWIGGLVVIVLALLLLFGR